MSSSSESETSSKGIRFISPWCNLTFNIIVFTLVLLEKPICLMICIIRKGLKILTAGFNWTWPHVFVRKDENTHTHTHTHKAEMLVFPVRVEWMGYTHPNDRWLCKRFLLTSWFKSWLFAIMNSGPELLTACTRTNLRLRMCGQFLQRYLISYVFVAVSLSDFYGRRLWIIQCLWLSIY